MKDILVLTEIMDTVGIFELLLEGITAAVYFMTFSQQIKLFSGIIQSHNVSVPEINS